MRNLGHNSQNVETHKLIPVILANTLV